ncbi:MAG: mercuric reductase [Labilithrix sp.]|nr:mercuric reductase [Labilithrix sp.]
MADEFDVIVIGAGPAGQSIAPRVVRGGLSAAVVEEELAGGDCAYYACIPSKALLRPVDLAGDVRRVPGMTLEPLEVAAVLARRDEAVSYLDDAKQVKGICSVPAEFVRGHGRLRGPKQVEVTTRDGSIRLLRARHAVVLATGSRPVIPPIPGLAEASPWVSRDATSVKNVPKRLGVLGGGVVACEMAQALHGLGAEQTTMLVRGHVLLGRMEPFAGELVAASLADVGVEVRMGVTVTKVERPAPKGTVTLHLSKGSPLEVDEVLVATGRRSATGDLGLETVGLPDTEPVRVDDSMRATSVSGGWLYAVGDVNGRNLLTHMGKYQARICGDVIAARAKGKPDDLPAMRDVADGRGAPQVVFTDPQVCVVGLTEAAAKAHGFDVRVVEYDIGQVSGAYLLGDNYRGRAKAVVDERQRVLLGVSFVGPDVTELLHSATIAVSAKVPLDRLWHAVPTFPTVSEIWLRLLEEYGL